MGADQLSACLSGQKHQPERKLPQTDLSSKPQGCKQISKNHEACHDVDMRSTMASHTNKSIMEYIKAHDFSTSNTNAHVKDLPRLCSVEPSHKDSSSFKTASSADSPTKGKKLSLSDFEVV